ncbi:MAG: hypothetical protein EON58_13960 [Alphaproteobacteria bacterium]|nr:MAG: hypothetical protein EON58_13960 [Alphaproteobacteria bacterium]
MCINDAQQLPFTMTPIDPVQTTSKDPRNSQAPPYVDENPNLALVQQGVDEAENEIREAVADDYEASARLSDEADEELDDIDFSSTDDQVDAPEVTAIHEESVLPDDEQA